MADLHGLEVDDYLKQCVDIEPIAIQEEFVRIPADMAYWGHRYAEAYKAAAMAEITEKKTKAALYVHHRQRLIDAGGKITEAQIDAAVDMDDQMQLARLETVRAEAERTRLKTVVDAVAAKREMVVSIGAQVRAEMQRDPMVRSQVAGARAIDENGR